MSTRSERHAAPELGARFTGARVLRRGERFDVIEAYEPEALRFVSIKVAVAGGAPWVAEQLDREAHLLTAIARHPHVVTLYGRATLDDGRPVLLFEHCRSTLDDLVHTGVAANGDSGTSVADAVAIGIKLAGALETIAAHGIAHCDVRPANVLITEDGEPVIAGLGESVRLDDAANHPPLHITTAHTAPELLEGAPPTPATDVYGLASTLYELIAGRAAFREYAGESAATVIVRVLSNPVRPILTAGVPLEVSDLLTWALSADPARRPPSPAWLAEELGRIQTQLGWKRTPMVGV